MHVVFGPLFFKLVVWCGAEGCVSGLRVAARKPYTWAYNRTYEHWIEVNF